MSSSGKATATGGSESEYISKIPLGGGYFKYPGYLKFAFQDIDDPHFGKATGLQGEIPFLTPPREFLECIEYMDKNPKEMEKLTWEMVRKYRDLWIEDTDEEIYQRLEVSLRCVFVVFGKSFDHNLPQKIWMMEFLTLMFPLDSYADNLLGTDAVGTGTGEGADFNYVDFCERFRGPRLPRVDAIPAGLAAFQRLHDIFHPLMDGAKAVAPNLDDEYGEMLGPEITSVIQSHFIFHGMGREKDGPKYSQWTMNELWRPITAYTMIFHFLIIFHKIKLSPRVQRSKLLQISFDRGCDLCALFNAVIGLHRDVRLKQLDSPITCSVEYEGMSLQKAWDTTLKRVHQAAHDYRLTSQKLLQVFTDEREEIQRYIEVIDQYISGMLAMYLTNDRYGHRHEVEVVETE